MCENKKRRSKPLFKIFQSFSENARPIYKMATSTFGRKQVVRRRRNRRAGKVKDFFCIVPADQNLV